MKQQHLRIHRISADRFYALATGKEDAFWNWLKPCL
ncbi:Eco47II family restriction endonuclease [Mitsuokella sp.]